MFIQDLCVQAWSELRVDELREEAYKNLMAAGTLPQDVNQIEEFEGFVDQLKGAMKSRIFEFDTECISEQDDYAALARAVLKTVPEAPVATIRSTLGDGKASLEITINDSSDHETWEQNSDWVESGFYKLLNRVAAAHFGGCFVLVPTVDQIVTGFFLPEPAATSVNEYFRRVESGDSDEEAEHDAILGALIEGSVFGLIVWLVGWLALGFFWAALAVGLIGLIAVSFRGASRAIDERKEREEARAMLRDDPGKWAIEYMNSLRAKSHGAAK
jgi:hypothetical protein